MDCIATHSLTAGLAFFSDNYEKVCDKN
eukprot:COSAG03_NODE_23737_length_277_cov_0.960674_1_plen_27_part_01